MHVLPTELARCPKATSLRILSSLAFMEINRLFSGHITFLSSTDLLVTDGPQTGHKWAGEDIDSLGSQSTLAASVAGLSS